MHFWSRCGFPKIWSCPVGYLNGRHMEAGPGEGVSSTVTSRKRMKNRGTMGMIFRGVKTWQASLSLTYLRLQNPLFCRNLHVYRLRNLSSTWTLLYDDFSQLLWSLLMFEWFFFLRLLSIDKIPIFRIDSMIFRPPTSWTRSVDCSHLSGFLQLEGTCSSFLPRNF